MIRVFFDTEFTDLLDPRLISIGLVDESGQRTFYAELTDTYRPEHCSDFVKAAVLPLLSGGNTGMTMAELTQQLGSWLTSLADEVSPISDHPLDSEWLHEIFDAESWPVNLMQPKVLSLPEANRIHFNRLAMQARKQYGLRFHHALDDARANQIALQNLETNK